MKRVLILLTIIIYSITLSAQDNSRGSESKVKWYTIEEAEKLIKKEPRPIFIDTYTDWCHWCLKLDAEVFTDPVIAKILNEKYYAVKFNAESKEPVMFQGKKFVNDGRYGKTHELAYALLNSKMSYPTVVFLNDKAQLITPVPGFRSAKEFEPILIYFSGKEWQTTNFNDFMSSFTGTIK